jgi:3alpha(or 20beta)-hydroxysteroid dehydrogenase
VGRLDGKVALVTGAAHGLGEVIAGVFAEEGAQVVVTDIADDLGSKVASSLGNSACYLHLDVSKPAEWRATVLTTNDRFGGIDVLVNNAGIARMGPLTEIVLEDYLETIMINQVGVFLGIQAVAPIMAHAGGGSIINIASPVGLKAVAGQAAYCATKAAILSTTRVAALELGPLGIRVNSVLPGKMLTGATNRPARLRPDDERAGGVMPPVKLPDPAVGTDVLGRIPLGRACPPEDVARMVAFLASDESAYATGADFVVDGGLFSTL